MVKKVLTFIVLITFATFNPSCFVLNGYQTAHLIKKNEIEITPSATLNEYANEHSYDMPTGIYGLRLAYGVSEKFNILSSYHFLHIRDYAHYNNIDLFFKFRLLKEKLAAGVQSNFYFGQNVETPESVNLQILLLYTLSISNNVSFTLAPNYILFVPSMHAIYSVNANAKFNINPLNISIIPEIGCSYIKSENYPIIHGGIGISYVFNISNLFK
jgi:hypothetical protein